MRKGHGSTKVPNVKLRPAVANRSKSSSKQSNVPSWVAQPSGDDDMSDVKHGTKRPFVGVLVCATAIEEKSTLLTKARELGAQISHPLTDSVTHLIAEKPGTAKYTYCVENHLPIMKPSWITDCHAKWLNGDDIDFNEALLNHRLPAFPSVRLCLTGFDDTKTIRHINALVTQNGGVFVKDLKSQSTEVTHLLFGKGTPEINTTRYAENLKKESNARIQLVWEEWFWDCLEFGGLLDEGSYDITLPRPKRRQVKRISIPPSSSLPDSSHSGSLPPSLPSATILNAPEADEVAAVKRIPDANVHLWGSLLKTRGFEVKSGKLVRSPSKPRGLEVGSSLPNLALSPSLPDNSHPLEASPTRGESSLSGFKRTRSFAPKEVPSGSRPLTRIQTSAVIQPSSHTVPRTLSAVSDSLGSSAAESFLVPNHRYQVTAGQEPLFAGTRFRAHGDANSSSVREAIESNGGLLVSETDAAVDFIIVRLASRVQSYFKEPDEHIRAQYRTECWMERCLFEERICDPEEHVTFRPLRLNLPVSGAEKLRIHSSGLDSWERCWTARLIRALGATTPDKFSRGSTHLLCPSGTGAKFDKAREWGIPAVGLEWLTAIAHTGVISTVLDYLVPVGGFPPISNEPISSKSAKGKITDITNSDSQGGLLGKQSPETFDVKSIALPPQTPLSQNGKQPSGQSLVNISANESVGQTNLLSSVDENVLTDETFTMSGSPRFPSKPSSQPSTPQRPLTTNDDIARDMETTQIPSSTSPSPMKFPENHQNAASSVTNGQSGALKEAITSLLGKRNPSEESSSLDQSRGGKRSKPLRARSKQNLSFSPSPLSSEMITRQRSSMLTSSQDLQLADSMDRAVNEEENPDESMRVTYEDPGQRHEKMKLLSLLENEGPQVTNKTEPVKVVVEGRSGRNLVRRSARAPGF
ncbi:hypothetical protein BD410DRAFT_765587 [Rickenella mellea]|uniref:BRCT domain-containing protein n=1 Tax=Rickenella mellea TaxID=50990 RepID=A0A4Y7QEK3_9AGAM|nr:hypothetical protein BD410DRAFT_765587 [Rickenella mellea]